MLWLHSAVCSAHAWERERKNIHGLVRDSNPGPLAPKARIIPLDQLATYTYPPTFSQLHTNHKRLQPTWAAVGAVDGEGAVVATPSDEGTWSWLEPPLVGLVASEPASLTEALSPVYRTRWQWTMQAFIMEYYARTTCTLSQTWEITLITTLANYLSLENVWTSQFS